MKKPFLFKQLAVLAALAITSSVSFGQISSAANMQIMQNGQNAKDQKDAAGAASDKTFVKKALEGGMFEIDAAKLALEKSSNDELKRFAQRMVDDHTKIGDDMKTVAAQINVKVPGELSKKDRASLSTLQGLSGADFDNSYVKVMLKDHQEDAGAFKQESVAGKIPVVKDAAAKAGPTIIHHLEMIQDIAKSMNIS